MRPTETEIRDGHIQALQSRDDEIDRLRSINAILLAALKRAVDRADKGLSKFSGRTPECQADYDACVAAIAKAAGDEP